MAPRSRRKFSPQFKAEAVQLVIQPERSIAEVDWVRADDALTRCGD